MYGWGCLGQLLFLVFAIVVSLFPLAYSAWWLVQNGDF